MRLVALSFTLVCSLIMAGFGSQIMAKPLCVCVNEIGAFSVADLEIFVDGFLDRSPSYNI